MKVIFFSNSCWSVYNFRINLIRTLLKKNFKIIVLAPFDGYEKKLSKIGCEVKKIKIQNNKVSIIADLILIINIFIKLFSHRKNSILLSFTIKPLIFGSLISGFLKIPTVCMITGLGTIFIKKNFIKKIVLILYKMAFKNVSYVLFQNKDDQRLFLNNNIIKKKITILTPGSGVDIKKYSYKEQSYKKSTIFLLAARILKEKGIIEYIKAAKLIKKNKLKIKMNLVGSFVDNNKSSLPQRIIFNAHKNKVINYLGFIDDIRNEIQKADCVVLPSYREGTPRFLLEGASMGRPIITTNVVGCKEVLRDNKNGFFCKVKDYKSLYLMINRFTNLNFNKKKKMSLYSRKFMVNNFDEKIVIGTYLKLINIIKKNES